MTTLPDIQIANSLIISLEQGRKENTQGCNGESLSKIYKVMLHFNSTILCVAEIIWAEKPVFNGSCFLGTLYDEFGSKENSYILESQDIASATLDLLENKFRSL